MENSRNDGGSWGSGLPCDLARCIGDRLDVLARICFRAVCRSWRAALPAGRGASIQSPLLIIPATTTPWRPGNTIPCRSLPLRSIVDSCGGTTTSNPLTLHAVGSGLCCVGSSGGWLAVADSDSVIRLVNGLTLQVAACLPPLPRNTEVRRLQGLGLVDPYFASQAPQDFDDMLLGREHTIHKVAFSVRPPRARGSSYAHSAAALHRTSRRRQGLALTFTRAGWDRWEWQQPGFFPAGEDEHLDVAYCQRSGVYYVVTPDWVWVLDMSAPVPTLEPLVRMSCGVSLGKVTVGERRHVVILSDDDDGGGALSQMYMVIIQEMQQRRVIVQRYTAGEPWSVVSDLGGRALLIANRAQSVSVLPTASSPPWLKRDCVYWMTSDEYGYTIAGNPNRGWFPCGVSTCQQIPRTDSYGQIKNKLEPTTGCWIGTTPFG